jgi:hypothetical protein
VVILVGQRVHDLLQTETVQIKHQARISLSHGPHPRTGSSAGGR